MKNNIIEEKSINENNIEILKRYFPNAIKLDDDGRYNIDSQALQLAINPNKAKIDEDGYSLNWVGKKEAYTKAYTKNKKILKPLESDSKEFKNTENILIKGDNIDALKILRNNYYEKIKMIYIDPPYNTKNDNFIYKDNFTSSELETLEELGYDSKDKIDYIKNIYGAKTHSGWLSFMFPRLLLAKDLLKDDGVIFISIDDNEVANLRLLCDEVFGEGNFVSQFVWEKSFAPKNDNKYISESQEYILLYSKNKDNFKRKLLPRTEAHNKGYSNTDNDKRGDWSSGTMLATTYNEKYVFSIEKPNGDKILPTDGRCWRYSEKKIIDLMKDNRIWFGKDGSNVPRIKRFLSEVQDGIVPVTLLKNKDIASGQDGTNEVKNIFNKQVFDFPKPSKLILHFLKITTNKSDLILDFFAGSGTTGDAVMQLNAEDGGNRKYILVQIPQEIDSKKQKTAYDFVKDELKKEPTIFEITAERLRRAGEKIKQESKEDIDIGFRVFEIVEDEKQAIYQKSLLEINQDDLNLFEKPQNEDINTILYNLLVSENLPLSSKIEEIIKDKFYIVDNIGFILNSFKLEDIEKYLQNLEYLTIYSPNIKDDKFSLELQNFVESLDIKRDKLRFRG